MGRKPRVEYAGALYHVMCRGNCREEIFHYGYDLSGNRTNAVYGITGRQVEWEYDPHNRIAQITDTQGYTGTINVSSGQNLQAAIDTAAEGSLILVGNGTYGSITLTNAITVQSQNGPASTRIAGGSPARPAKLSGNARLIGFTLSGGTLGGTNNGAGAFVDKGCLISDCIVTSNQTALCSNAAVPGGKGGGLYLRGTALRCTIENNTAWNGAGAFLEDGASMAGCTVVSNTASGVNSYGGGLYLQDGATAINCTMANNAATDGGGLFFEKGGLAQSVSSISNTVDSIGGAGAFLWAGGTLRNGIIEANVATNQYARGGAGILFYDEGGLVEDSTIAGNLSVTNGGIHYRYSGIVDPGSLGTLNNSILWNNGTQSTVWSGTGNQTIDPSTTNSATGADIPASPYASTGTRTTSYKYDLNGNPLKRTYPTGVVELREYDALNRLNSIINQSAGTAWTAVTYHHDAVGNLRQMDDTVMGLAGIPQSATWTWIYDAAYRLLSENVDDASSFVRRTEYDWDPAGNREEMRKYTRGSLTSTNSYAPASALNQMLGWSDGTTNAVYQYDANGARTNATLIAGTSTNATTYAYDEDNRLLGASISTNSVATLSNAFAYDYRTRRYYRATSTETNLCIFDGGLSIQEYDASQNPTPNAQSLSVEYLRGPDLGGGIGGMVYSIRADGIRCSHANHRGDVVARTGPAGQLTWFARYEAYGTRFDETGTNPDRQMANTKDEEKDLGLSNQGMRWEDLKHGVWLTLDPIGYGDGPNRYAYVHCNPITSFDPLGLDTYLLVRTTQTDGIGHSAFAVADYKKVTNDAGETSYESTGTYTLHELNMNMFGNDYSETKGLTSENLMQLANEKNAFSKYNGMIRFDTAADADMKAADALKQHGIDNPNYKFFENNCSDYAKVGVEAATGKKVDGTETTELNGVKVTSTTPNALFKDTSKLSGAKLVVNPGSDIDTPTKDVMRLFPDEPLPDEPAEDTDDDTK